MDDQSASIQTAKFTRMPARPHLQGSMEGETRHPLLLVAIFLLLLATLAALLSSKPADDFESPPIGISQRTSAS
jgi:hypothetical protein